METLQLNQEKKVLLGEWETLLSPEKSSAQILKALKAPESLIVRMVKEKFLPPSVIKDMIKIIKDEYGAKFKEIIAQNLGNTVEATLVNVDCLTDLLLLVKTNYRGNRSEIQVIDDYLTRIISQNRLRVFKSNINTPDADSDCVEKFEQTMTQDQKEQAADIAYLLFTNEGYWNAYIKPVFQVDFPGEGMNNDGFKKHRLKNKVLAVAVFLCAQIDMYEIVRLQA